MQVENRVISTFGSIATHGELTALTKLISLRREPILNINRIPKIIKDINIDLSSDLFGNKLNVNINQGELVITGTSESSFILELNRIKNTQLHKDIINKLYDAFMLVPTIGANSKAVMNIILSTIAFNMECLPAVNRGKFIVKANSLKLKQDVLNVALDTLIDQNAIYNSTGIPPSNTMSSETNIIVFDKVITEDDGRVINFKNITLSNGTSHILYVDVNGRCEGWALRQLFESALFKNTGDEVYNYLLTNILNFISNNFHKENLQTLFKFLTYFNSKCELNKFVLTEIKSKLDNVLEKELLDNSQTNIHYVNTSNQYVHHLANLISTLSLLINKDDKEKDNTTAKILFGQPLVDTYLCTNGAIGLKVENLLSPDITIPYINICGSLTMVDISERLFIYINKSNQVFPAIITKRNIMKIVDETIIDNYVVYTMTKLYLSLRLSNYNKNSLSKEKYDVIEKYIIKHIGKLKLNELQSLDASIKEIYPRITVGIEPYITDALRSTKTIQDLLEVNQLISSYNIDLEFVTGSMAGINVIRPNILSSGHFVNNYDIDGIIIDGDDLYVQYVPMAEPAFSMSGDQKLKYLDITPSRYPLHTYMQFDKEHSVKHFNKVVDLDKLNSSYREIVIKAIYALDVVIYRNLKGIISEKQYTGFKFSTETLLEFIKDNSKLLKYEDVLEFCKPDKLTSGVIKEIILNTRKEFETLMEEHNKSISIDARIERLVNTYDVDGDNIGTNIVAGIEIEVDSIKIIFKNNNDTQRVTLELTKDINISEVIYNKLVSHTVIDVLTRIDNSTLAVDILLNNITLVNSVQLNHIVKKYSTHSCNIDRIRKISNALTERCDKFIGNVSICKKIKAFTDTVNITKVEGIGHYNGLKVYGEATEGVLKGNIVLVDIRNGKDVEMKLTMKNRIDTLLTLLNYKDIDVMSCPYVLGLLHNIINTIPDLDKSKILNMNVIEKNKQDILKVKLLSIEEAKNFIGMLPVYKVFPHRVHCVSNVSNKLTINYDIVPGISVAVVVNNIKDINTIIYKKAKHEFINKLWNYVLDKNTSFFSYKYETTVTLCSMLLLGLLNNSKSTIDNFNIDNLDRIIFMALKHGDDLITKIEYFQLYNININEIENVREDIINWN